ncbi:hypothetical protein GC177_03490 [bacterium]|nr:hypothetical protein [bacterium]
MKSPSSTAPLRDRIIPWYFVLFFLALVLIDGTMVTLAVTSQTGTVTDHPYEKGLAYNKVVAAADAQARLGWKSTIQWKAQAGSQGTVTIRLTDRNDSPIDKARTHLAIMRPSQDGMDFSVELKEISAGTYSSAITFPAKGLWELRAYADRGNETYQHAIRLVVE